MLVQLRNRELKEAIVEQVCYLNWKCTGAIRGKVSEAVIGEDGSWDLQNAPTVVGLANNEALVAELERLGWVQLKPGHVHMAVLTNSNQTASANILVRRNGVDLQILPARRSAMPQRFGLDHESLTQGRVVRHHLSFTTFNLYEGILRFAASFMSDEGDYDRFFKSVGRAKQRRSRPEGGEVLMRDIYGTIPNDPGDDRDFLRDFYDTNSSGPGDRVYLGGGVWLGDGGRVIDWER